MPWRCVPCPRGGGDLTELLARFPMLQEQPARCLPRFRARVSLGEGAGEGRKPRWERVFVLSGRAGRPRSGQEAAQSSTSPCGGGATRSSTQRTFYQAEARSGAPVSPGEQGRGGPQPLLTGRGFGHRPGLTPRRWGLLGTWPLRLSVTCLSLRGSIHPRGSLVPTPQCCHGDTWRCSQGAVVTWSELTLLPVPVWAAH